MPASGTMPIQEESFEIESTVAGNDCALLHSGGEGGAFQEACLSDGVQLAKATARIGNPAL